MPGPNFKVKTKGMKALERKIQNRQEMFVRRKEHIFVDPLKRTLNNIRKRLQKDTQAGGINHVYTGRMLNSVGTRHDSPSDGTMTILFGLFVPYGRVFELGGKPRFVPYATLAAWSKHRFGTTDPTKPIQHSIRNKGTRGYGIVMRTWEGNKNYYLSIVHGRFWKVWT